MAFLSCIQYNVEGALTMVHSSDSSVQSPPKFNNKQQLPDDSEEHAGGGGTASQPTIWVQLVLMLVIALPLQFDTVVSKAWLRNNDWILRMCSCGSYCLLFFMFLSVDADDYFLPCLVPVNNFMVYAFIIMEAMMTGFVTAFYNTELIMEERLAWVVIFGLASVVIFGALNAYACATKADFTGMGPYLWCAFCALFVLTSLVFALMLFGALFVYSCLWPIYQMLASLASILCLCFIVYKVQMIFGGSHADDRGWATPFVEI